MSGFVQPQWSGFSSVPGPQSGTGEADPQPTGLEIERSTLGRAVPPAASPLPPKPLPPPAVLDHAPAPPLVTSASPRPLKALTA
jgi:hypothetical protein